VAARCQVRDGARVAGGVRELEVREVGARLEHRLVLRVVGHPCKARLEVQREFPCVGVGGNEVGDAASEGGVDHRRVVRPAAAVPKHVLRVGWPAQARQHVDVPGHDGQAHPDRDVGAGEAGRHAAPVPACVRRAERGFDPGR
jgi:hypothetical protein